MGRVLAVTSGKGGVGKTGIALNLSACLAARGNRVLLLDGDLGLGNVDVMVGLTPTRSLDQVLNGGFSLADVILEGPAGLRIIPAGTGVARLARLGKDGQRTLLAQVAALTPPPDYLIVDTSSGIGDNVRFLAACAQEVLVVTTPEPTAVTDAYALMKVLARTQGTRRFRLVVNLAETEAVALEVYHRLSVVADRFLGVGLDLAGFVPPDRAVPAAVQRRNGVLTTGHAAGAMRRLAETVAGWRPGEPTHGGLQLFVNQMAEPGDSAS